jgi:hypothetical protein
MNVLQKSLSLLSKRERRAILGHGVAKGPGGFFRTSSSSRRGAAKPQPKETYPSHPQISPDARRLKTQRPQSRRGVGPWVPLVVEAVVATARRQALAQGPRQI